MYIGYCRVSTVDQKGSLETQQEQLKKAGCEPSRIFSESISGVAEIRPVFDEALRHLRTGDVLVVTKADRLARNTLSLLKIVEQINEKGCSMVILNFHEGNPLDTGNPHQRLFLTMLSAVAEFERSIILERQKEGIQRAKEKGKYKGRKKTLFITQEQRDKVIRMWNDDVPVSRIAEEFQCSRQSVYQFMNTVPEE